MTGNIFGTLFRIATFGESHGVGVGAVVDGCPAGLELTPADIQKALDRRRPGQSLLTTARKEADIVEILSGVERGKTLGSPVTLLVRNADTNPPDYSFLKVTPRPSHSDYTYTMKYGHTSMSGGGRASARETVGRVAAGAVAEKLIATRHGVEIVAWVSSVETISASSINPATIQRSHVDTTPVRCPDLKAAEAMTAAIKTAQKEKDSIGGIITCVCRNIPVGWGEPVFQKASAILGAAMLSIPSVKGFEIGAGFAGTRSRGSQLNDLFIAKKDGVLGTRTNNSGGIQGGITNGEPIVFRVAFKPVSSIARLQETADYKGNPTKLEVKGRHDPCVLPRAVPIVEAMAALVLADLSLMALASAP